MPSHELRQVIESADSAINREDFDALMNFMPRMPPLSCVPA